MFLNHTLTRGNTKSYGCMKKQYQALFHDRLHDLDDSEGLNGNDEADGYDDDDD